MCMYWRQLALFLENTFLCLFPNHIWTRVRARLQNWNRTDLRTSSVSGPILQTTEPNFLDTYYAFSFKWREGGRALSNCVARTAEGHFATVSIISRGRNRDDGRSRSRLPLPGIG